jgi:large subunit ribosomal protein L32e
MMTTEDSVKIRRDRKRKLPKFTRQEYFKSNALKKGWRRPKGIRSKLRLGIKERGKVPKPGYGSPKDVRGFHSSGKREILVSCLKDLENISKDIVVRLSGKLGLKRKIEFTKKVEEVGVRVLNPTKGEIKKGRKVVEKKPEIKTEEKKDEIKPEVKTETKSD